MVKHKGAVGLEEQARACEYDALFGFDTLRPQLLEHMPVLDEAKYARNLAPAAAVDMSTEPAAAQVRTANLLSCVLRASEKVFHPAAAAAGA